jgi:hypothetical protein
MFQSSGGFTNRVDAGRVQREDGSKLVLGTFACTARSAWQAGIRRHRQPGHPHHPRQASSTGWYRPIVRGRRGQGETSGSRGN